MNSLPGLSRAQISVMLLLGAVLLSLYAWRENFGRTASNTPAVGSTPVFVEVVGQVPQPGVYPFSAPPTLLELWRRSGGPEPSRDATNTISSGSRVEVSSAGEYRLGRMSGSRLLTLGQALDLNTAAAEDLEALPGLGPVLARRIIQYRESHGPFKNLEDLAFVSGVGKKKLAHLKPYLMVWSTPSSSGP